MTFSDCRQLCIIIDLPFFVAAAMATLLVVEIPLLKTAKKTSTTFRVIAYKL
jgi:hypothetical protein